MPENIRSKLDAQGATKAQAIKAKAIIAQGMKQGNFQVSPEAQRRVAANMAIARVYHEFGGSPGNFVGDLVAEGPGFYRQYERGRIYFNPDLGAFYVYGAIGDKYIQLGGTSSWLGWPISHEEDFSEGGRVTKFQNGAIYFWGDTGPIELKAIRVRYTGLACFGVTNDGAGGLLGAGTGDEPYLIMAPVPLSTLTENTYRTKVPSQDAVHAGDALRDNINLYEGDPYGMVLGVVLMESDYGDPDKFKKQVEEAVGDAVDGISTGAGALFGSGAGTVVDKVGKALAPEIAKAVNKLLDTDDDVIGTCALNITPKQMVTLAKAPPAMFRGISFKLDTPLISGDGGSYKAHFSIDAI